MSIRLVVAKSSGVTGRTLEGLLRARGLEVNQGATEATVSYGVGMQGIAQPALNANVAGGNKYEELQRLARAGVVVPGMYPVESINLLSARKLFPLLGRRRRHRGGTDIRLVANDRQFLYWRSRRDFFTQVIPSDREFRVWIYRNSHLATYEKVLAHPEMVHSFGRNRSNGYAFALVKSDQVPRVAVEESRKAILALELDFGAVDVLQGKDGRFYVLEVNTAPGVEGPGRQGITALADHIARWVKAGYPGRRDKQDAE